MSPRFIRSKTAYSVKTSASFEDFLDTCRDERLLRKVEQTFTDLKGNYELGRKVPKNYWPSYYVREWGINNLYLIKLGLDWRLTYTLVAEGGGISVVCLEILQHRDYDRRFGYSAS